MRGYDALRECGVMRIQCGPRRMRVAKGGGGWRSKSKDRKSMCCCRNGACCISQDENV